MTRSDIEPSGDAASGETVFFRRSPMDPGRIAEYRKQALDTIDDFAYVFDLDGRFQYVNKPLLDLWGLRLDQAVGKNFFDLSYPPELAAKLQSQIQHVVQTAEKVVDETPYTSPTGVAGVYQYIFTPVRGAKGEVAAVAGSTRDISSMKRVEDALRLSREQMEIVVREANVGVWYCPLPFDKLFWDDKVKEHFHLPPEAAVTIETFYDRMHPDDRERTRQTVEECITQHLPYDIEYRTISPDGGKTKWIRACGHGFYDAQGHPTRFDGITIDNTALRNAEQERERLLVSEQAARAEAESANNAKDKFLAVLSHELRTPLSPVVLTLPQMENDPELPQRFREDLAMIRRNIELEVKLIDDLLDLSRISSGKLSLVLEPVRIHELLRHVMQSAQADCRTKGIHMTAEFAAENDLVKADPTRIQQVFWNLTRNALKFTPASGAITFRTCNLKGNGRLHVGIQDSGIGIPAEVLPRIFDAFEQGDARVTRLFGGLGLGLAIARAVVEMHGGTISAESPGKDQGATFTIALPTIVPEQVSVPVKPGGGAAVDQLKRPQRILLVEDHPDTSVTMARLLKISGFDVQIALSSAAALKLAAAQPFDVVVSDIGLPDATGYDLMQQLKSLYAIQGIALSGYGMEEDLRKSREAGFSEHLTKPVNITLLQSALRRLTGNP